MTDPHEARSLSLLTPEDREYITRIERTYLIDPGRMTPAEVANLDSDEKEYRDWQLSLWHGAFPYVETRNVVEAGLQLGTVAVSDPGRGAPLRAVSLITGPPGVGKSTILQQRAVQLMKKAARIRRIQLDKKERGEETELRALRGAFRPVLEISLHRHVTDKQLFTRLCHALPWPPGDDPSANFIAGLWACGTEAVLIDEIQYVNFDHLAGRYVHDALKAITNAGIRVILCGHSMEATLTEVRKSLAHQSAQDQSGGRWEVVRIDRMAYSTPEDRKDWADLLHKVEERLRLAGHPEGERILSEDLAEFLWVSTGGYLNSLATLITKATQLAQQTRRQRLSQTLFSKIHMERRSDSLRAERTALWKAGELEWQR